MPGKVSGSACRGNPNGWIHWHCSPFTAGSSEGTWCNQQQPGLWLTLHLQPAGSGSGLCPMASHLLQVCHHAECQQVNHSSPLNLCEACDHKFHGTMHFDGHIRFDLPPQGESLGPGGGWGLVNITLLPRGARSAMVLPPQLASSQGLLLPAAGICPVLVLGACSQGLSLPECSPQALPRQMPLRRASCQQSTRQAGERILVHGAACQRREQ